MATRDSTTPPRIVYQSPEGRVRIERSGPRDFSLFLDDSFSGTHEFECLAMARAGAWMHEQVEQLAARLETKGGAA